MEANQVKSIVDKKNKVMCDSCEHYFDSSSITKNKNGYNYCKSCNNMQISALKYNKAINKTDFDKMLKMALDTPPLEFD
jgi:Pyruvate/2-oxoacid:ferredoxin oxidoreductase delta subunit